MRKLAALFCLLSFPAMGQTGAPAAPSLVRVYDGGSDCTHYPGSLFTPNVSGTVQLRYTVGSDGSVTDVTLAGSSGDKQLDRGAADCARSWKFVAPQETGQAAPVTATAIVTYAASDKTEYFGVSRVKREGTVNWRTPGVRSAATVAMADIYGRGVQCLRAQPDLAAPASTALSSQLKLFLSGGEILRVAVTASSGSDALDKAAIACFGAVPKDKARAKYLADSKDADIVLAWRTLYGRAP